MEYNYQEPDYGYDEQNARLNEELLDILAEQETERERQLYREYYINDYKGW